MIIRLFLAALITVNISMAQTAEEVLEKYNIEFSKPQYMQYLTKYTLYRGHTSKEILESYDGVFKKNKQNDVYLKAQNNELITNKQMSITISNTEKAIFVENPRPYSAGEFDIKQLLPYFKVEPLEIRDGLFKISLVSTPVSGLPYNKIEIYLNKNYQVLKQVFYFSTAYNVSKDYTTPQYIYPKLVIENTGYKYDPIPEEIFKAQKYIIITGTTLSSKLKAYKVYDKRIKQ